MRLKLDYQVSEEDSEFVETIKRNLIAEIATDNLVNLLEYDQSSMDSRINTIRADFFVLTEEQARRLIQVLPTDYRCMAKDILKEEIPELNISTT